MGLFKFFKKSENLDWYYKIQSLVLLGGTIFAYYTVAGDFARFYNLEGTIFKIKDCVIPNPVTTACFYGAFAFLVALIWSVVIKKSKAKNRKSEQKKLNWLIWAGVLFAWTNFTYQVIKYYSLRDEVEEIIGCSGIVVNNPFATPCFYGATIFMVALVISMVILNKEGKNR